jgi:Conserved region in glutamate synthase
MTVKSILDDVFVTPVALMPALPSGFGPALNTTRIIQTPTGRKLPLTAPFFAKGLSAKQLSTNWPMVCGILRANGLPIYATVQELQAVPAAQVPARIAQRFIGQPLVHDEVTLSDAFELANCDRNGSSWSWPYEISSGRDLKTLVTTLRSATGGEVPIGMSLPLNAKPADVRMSLDSTVDYITLTHCNESLASSSQEVASQAALGIVAARRLFGQYGRPRTPLLLDAPIVSSDHIIKLLALGASAINIASVIRNAIPASEPKRYESMLTENLLGGLPSAQKVVRELPQVERELAELIQKLCAVMRFTGLLDISALDCSCLQSTNSGVADQLGVTLASRMT